MKSFASCISLMIMLALLAVGIPSMTEARTPPPDMSLGAEWQPAVEELRAMPVQDTGFIRSAYTFAENYISAISGKRSVGKVSALEAVLYLMRDQQAAQDVKLIKVSQPDLVQIYGSGYISANQWSDDASRQRLMVLVQQDQEKWMKPINSIAYRASLLEDVDSEFAIVPRKGEWITPTAAAAKGNLDENDQRIVSAWNSLHKALKANDAKAGAEAAGALRKAVDDAVQARGVVVKHLKLDLFYHEHQPFRNSATLYLFAALFYAAGMILGRPKLGWGGYTFLALGLVEQIIGIVSRWMLAGRAPLSNMYESFTFAVAGMVLVALVLEAMKLVRMAGLAGGVLGFIFMVIAHKAPIFDSQIRPLMPALQSSWLTYHVVTIMLSYSAFALSFFVSVVYLGKSFFMGGDAGTSFIATRIPSLRSLDVFNYRIIAVGFPLLTLGIIFGAVWAATAWGRPWGFDPKETWSAITWLIYAIYLHVRFLAGWSGRRAAILSIIGFGAVMFTYLGVNYLLPGLHSYV